MRVCKKCGKEKSLNDFEITNKERNNRRWECRDCVKKRLQAWYVKSKKHIREYYASEKGTKTREAARKRVKEWQKGPGKERHNENCMHNYYKNQNDVIMVYGGYKCACCGETEPLFLTIDHINNDGNKHRKEISSGDGLYKWLKKHNYPEGFQVLCMNCNHGKRRNGGICPHKGIYSGTNKLVKSTCRDYLERE